MFVLALLVRIQHSPLARARYTVEPVPFGWFIMQYEWTFLFYFAERKPKQLTIVNFYFHSLTSPAAFAIQKVATIMVSPRLQLIHHRYLDEDHHDEHDEDHHDEDEDHHDEDYDMDDKPWGQVIGASSVDSNGHLFRPVAAGLCLVLSALEQRQIPIATPSCTASTTRSYQVLRRAPCWRRPSFC